MTQTMTAQVKGSDKVKANLLKRKDSTTDANDQHKKQKPSFHTDTEFWNKIPILNQDSRTSGIIPRLEPNFKKRDTLSAYLCSPATDHLSTGFMDLGWGCGYRNCQMLMSYLEQQQQDGEPILRHVLDIHGIQLLIEQAWKEGFDTLGAAQLDHRVFKTRKWIGTTEVYTLFAYLGIRSTIIDFHQPGPNHLHHQLMDWIQSYFSTNIKQTNKTVYITDHPPLYLQHQGHSRTVVGIELLKSGKRNLIMFDPGRRMLRSYRHSKQESETEEEEEEEIDILSHEDTTPHIGKRFLSRFKNNRLPSNLLKPFRVDDKSIGKHKQYQILVLGQVNYQDGKMAWDPTRGFLLSEQERESMKNVTSLTVM
ncbi:peptidase family C78-domain-containing protein [Gilbertella persicaria]|uniref:peptidase family C78-domain-containing protein n=1 Tax=Gilbertella persicaria TaxID=101096 RepID=UPI002220528A|nr:peptidase family C78-domain-containing protein [Gilbertella persicaria]KAI8090150.1 peptidase family C78-domain-containing protein [Gilbertella persicaria]